VITTRWAVAPRWLARAVLFGLVLLIGYGARHSWRTPLARLTRHPGRHKVFAYVAAFLVVGQPFNHLWGFLYVGPALMGLAFAPAALRDLWRRA
jgi:hypothetical protein